MFRDNWRAFSFWRWWWRHRVSTSVKHVVALAFAAVLLVGGYFASNWLAGASAASGLNTYIVQTTVTRVTTERIHGRTIVKRVPVVIRRTIVKSKTKTAFDTVVDTRVVTTPGGVRYVVRKVTHLVPVVRSHVVRVNGKTTTVTQTRLVPTVKTQTQIQTNVVTNLQTVTNESTVVLNHTDTLVQSVTDTVTNTTTNVVTNTVTLPPQTVTETDTIVQTVTQPVTITVTT
jgi:hypothetical protein